VTEPQDVGEAPSYGPYPNPPRGLRRLARCVWVLGAGWTFLGVALTSATLVSLLTFRIGSTAWFPYVTRFCGRMVLRLFGVELRVTGAERIAGRRMRIIAVNHTSQLDLFIGAALMPAYGTGVGKRELLRVPFIGWFMFAFRFLLIDRGSIEHAKGTLAAAARRLRERQATVFYSPEGTRSRTGELLPFKMGLFHLAAASGAPIVPAVIHGAKDVQPMGTLVPTPGVVWVDLLPEITVGGESDDLHARREELRELFVRELA